MALPLLEMSKDSAGMGLEFRCGELEKRSLARFFDKDLPYPSSVLLEEMERKGINELVGEKDPGAGQDIPNTAIAQDMPGQG
jgi:hypothetical protein